MDELLSMQYSALQANLNKAANIQRAVTLTEANWIGLTRAMELTGNAILRAQETLERLPTAQEMETLLAGQAGSLTEAHAEAVRQIQQAVREKTLKKFRDGQLRVLAATDVAARGLDIDDVDAVFNYDVPDENEYYIHRIGRTGRAKRHGVAFTLVSSVGESIRMDDIQKNTGNTIRAVYFNEKGDLVAAVVKG